MLDFANVNDLSKASSKGGDGSSDFAFDDFGGDLGPPSDVVIEQKIEEPDPYEFISVEQEPYIDIAELQRKVVYPPLAIRAGVEGKVFIRVLVGPNGKPLKSMVEQSDSELLEKAAQKAVMDSQFTPAIQNGKPVQCWVSIPVSFKLK
jgi:protein TonB